MIEKISKAFFSRELKYYIIRSTDRAGITLSLLQIFRRLVFISSLLSVLSLFILQFRYSYFNSYDNVILGIVIMSAFIVMFAVSFLSCLAFFALVLNLRIHMRTKEMENVLPTFLELVSSNIRAGMSIDKAMWLSIRPKFGVLATEIEKVAKETMTGKDLETSLKEFGKKYDSPLLERTVNLIIEGLRAGGEMGELLDRIATDIQETHLIREEMSESVTTYVIFITFTVLLAAPFLFGLSYGLLFVVQNITSGLSTSSISSVSSMPLEFSEPGITLDDFRVFAMASLAVTSFFSALMVAVIRRGSAKEGLKYIPFYIAFTTILFSILTKVVVVAFQGLLN